MTDKTVKCNSLIKAFDPSNKGDLLFSEFEAIASSYNTKAVVSAATALLLRRVKSVKGLHTIANVLLSITKKDMEKIHGCSSDSQREENENPQKRIGGNH